MACPVCPVDERARLDYLQTLTLLIRTAAANPVQATTVLPDGTCTACLRALLDGMGELLVGLLQLTAGEGAPDIVGAVDGVLYRLASRGADTLTDGVG